MVIENAKYQNADSLINENTSVLATIDGEVMSVPMDTGNRHYAEILKQVADGTITIAEAD
jgi:hypothetical protein|tara:strand:+ start:352 stop:531 length:180 start_codon:yes stop_codon:yes gene_type:complete